MTEADDALPGVSASAAALSTGSLLRLMSWLSPAFPVGAFAYSHGLEAAVADGLLRTGEDVRGWIAALLRRGSGWNDLLLLGEAPSRRRSGRRGPVG